MSAIRGVVFVATTLGVAPAAPPLFEDSPAMEIRLRVSGGAFVAELESYLRERLVAAYSAAHFAQRLGVLLEERADSVDARVSIDDEPFVFRHFERQDDVALKLSLWLFVRSAIGRAAEQKVAPSSAPVQLAAPISTVPKAPAALSVETARVSPWRLSALVTGQVVTNRLWSCGASGRLALERAPARWEGELGYALAAAHPRLSIHHFTSSVGLSLPVPTDKLLRVGVAFTLDSKIAQSSKTRGAVGAELGPQVEWSADAGHGLFVRLALNARLVRQRYRVSESVVVTEVPWAVGLAVGWDAL